MTPPWTPRDDGGGEGFLPPPRWGIAITGAAMFATMIALGAWWALTGPVDKRPAGVAVLITLGVVVVLGGLALAAFAIAHARVRRAIEVERPAATLIPTSLIPALRSVFRRAGVAGSGWALPVVALTTSDLELWVGGSGPALVVPWTEVRDVRAGWSAYTAGINRVETNVVIVRMRDGGSGAEIPIPVSRARSSAERTLAEFARHAPAGAG